VVLRIEVDTRGLAQNITVRQGLGLGSMSAPWTPCADGVSARPR